MHRERLAWARVRQCWERPVKAALPRTLAEEEALGGRIQDERLLAAHDVEEVLVVVAVHARARALRADPHVDRFGFLAQCLVGPGEGQRACAAEQVGVERLERRLGREVAVLALQVCNGSTGVGRVERPQQSGEVPAEPVSIVLGDRARSARSSHLLFVRQSKDMPAILKPDHVVCPPVGRQGHCKRGGAEARCEVRGRVPCSQPVAERAIDEDGHAAPDQTLIVAA